MPQAYSSGFEAAVGSFLQNYAAMRGLKGDEAERKIRQRQANRADQMARIQMSEAGYDEVPMPKIEAPPGQSWAQRIGRMISGGPEQPGSVVMKMRPSTREKEIQAASEASVADREDTQRFGIELEAIKAANARTLNQEREAGDTARTRMNNRTQITVAGVQKQPNAQDRAKDEVTLRHQFVDDAIAAAGGNAVQAMKNVEQFQMPRARALGLTRTDYHAAADRYRDRKAALTREAIDSREQIAAQRGKPMADFQAFLKGDISKAEYDRRRKTHADPAAGSRADPLAQQRADWDLAAASARSQGKNPQAILGPRPPHADPTSAMSDAELWEHYVDQGLSNDAATARVRSRRQPN